MLSYDARKTQHSGPKKGNGAHWGRKKIREARQQPEEAERRPPRDQGLHAGKKDSSREDRHLVADSDQMNPLERALTPTRRKT